jgi:DNA-binding FadR family transcriptional regulator
MAGAESGVTMAYMSAAAIAEDLIVRIQMREFPPDSRLPAFVELAGWYDCPEPRIKHAMVRVAASGLVEYRQGKGWYVREGL